MNSKSKYEKTRAFEAEKEEFEEDVNREDAVSLVSRSVNQLWKQGQKMFRGDRGLDG